MDTESLQIEIQAALCSLSEERLKEVCSGLNITVPPESKGRSVFIRAPNKYLETEELDNEKLKVLSSSLSMQGKFVPEQKTEPPKASENNKATVKIEQNPVVSNFKIQTRLQDFGPDRRRVAEGSFEFFLASASNRERFKERPYRG